MSQEKSADSSVKLTLPLFFISGALALVYEVVWSRMMMQVFGSTAIAVGTVLAAFMSGMAIGSWLIGKIADKSHNCLRLYAILEFGIGLAAIVSHVLLDRMAPAHLTIFNLFGSSTAIFPFVRFLIAFLLVMVPTALMGATLPVLTRFLLNRRTTVGINLSTLYAINTFGAVTGVLLTGFFLIGKYGIHVPVYMAVIGNLLIGCIAWMVSLGLSEPSTTPLSPAAELHAGLGRKGGTSGGGTIRFILFGLGISGFTSFAYEIYWARSLVFLMGSSTYALTTMLSAFLTGIALGGYLIRFVLKRIQDRMVIFGWVQVFLGIFSSMALPILFSISDPQTLGQFLNKPFDQVYPVIFARYGVAFLVMLVPATLIGATFPLVGEIVVKDLRTSGASVGRIYAINTLGNVLGALLPGFILLNWLGIQRGILAMAVLNGTLGFVVLFMRLIRPSRHRLWRLVLPAVVALTVIIMSRTPLKFQFPSDGEFDYFKTYFYREGPSATTKVYLNPRTEEKHMSVDGIVIGGTGYVEFKQLLLAHFPKLLLDDVSKELSVGLGSGILAGESLFHSRVHEITSVEIEPSVVEGAEWFAKENHAVLENPRLKSVIDDIGNFLRTTSERYNVITADEKTADDYASNGFSYSLEYYDLLRSHLAPGGLVAQWIPTTLPSKQFQMILRTFSEGFPHVQLWYFLPAFERGPFNTILIGSNQPVAVDYDSIGRRLAEDPEAYKNLVSFGLTSAEAVLGHFVADERIILGAVKTAPLNTFDHPRYEFFSPRDYTAEKEKRNTSNHQFIIELRRKGYPHFVASLKNGMGDTTRLERTLAAEERFLVGFQRFLEGGMSLSERYGLFDGILSMAPWNDSLRAQIYSIYRFTAASQTNPSARNRLMQRANSLYEKKQ